MKTPITDAAEIEVCHVDDQGGGWLNAVPVEVARKLEMELNEARRTLERIAVFYRGGERATESMLEMRAIAKRALSSSNNAQSKTHENLPQA